MAQLPPSLAHKPAGDWTVHDVSAWLGSINLDQYSPAFVDANVDGERLCDVTEHDLEHIYKIQKASHRKKIFRRLQYVRVRREESSSKGKGRGRGRKVSKYAAGVEGSRDDMAARKLTGLDLGLYLGRYEPGCTYCREPERCATVHCPVCVEFLCGACDSKVHRHIKRRGHKRTLLSKFGRSGQIIISLFRFGSCRDELKERARAAFRVSYDPFAKLNLYRNLWTKAKQWNKPYCLKNEDIELYMTDEQAVDKIIAAYRCWRAHLLAVSLIHGQYQKLWSMERGHYIYRYIGILDQTRKDIQCRVKSKHVPTEDTRRKPLNLHSKDLLVLVTKDLAALRIQLFFLTVIAKKRSRSRVRQLFMQILDPITGRHFFVNPKTGRKTWTKPLLLGNEEWDPTDVRLWDVEGVFVYFRRMGLSKFGYTRLVRRYSIDGLLLLSFEAEDYHLLGIDRISTKRLLLHLQRSAAINGYVLSDDDLRRRDRLRSHHKIIKAVVRIQTLFRWKLAVQKAAFQNLKARRMEKELEKAQAESSVKWWSELLKDMPHDKRFWGDSIIA